ncbi:amidase [Janthinobacterium sp. PLB04]|uniref:Amidase n=1 Tax=Janthinobacterium lividum TaxID=29581 RepID=A0AAJ4T391_9BURK|nr:MULTISPECIES: amidase [Janthinobacterium]KAB0325087.1 amidase [Janthinobacterium lividum]QSX94176.1 amidase [Janthinobacterium lividum]UGQ33943.1 amidase [Janthinobacterium sp. PLB04]
MQLHEYTSFDGLGLAQLLRDGDVSAVELHDAAVRACAAVNPQINAVVELWPADLTAIDSSAPFAGVPFLIKDVAVTMAGQRSEAGSRLGAGHVAALDSHLMTQFRAAGLATFGRTSTPEMAFATTTEPVLYGATRNPWNLGLSAGGSSGGAAAAVAAGIVPLAHATDAAGSIRVPAASTGLFGFKPSRGRVSNGPAMDEIFSGLGVQLGVSRTVRDSAALLDAVQAILPGEPYLTSPPSHSWLSQVSAAPGKLRIAVQRAACNDAHPVPAVDAALDTTMRLLQSLGHHVEEVQAALGVSWEAFVHANASIWCANLVPWIDALAQESGRAVSLDNLEAATLACYRHGQTISAVDFVAALDVRNTVTRHAGALFGKYDVLLTPTMPDVPWPLGRYGEKEEQLDGVGWTARLFEHSPYTPLANVAGLPAMSVPLGMSDDGLPIGMQFMAGYAKDGVLLRLAGQLERAAPWVQRRPPVWAGN